MSYGSSLRSAPGRGGGSFRSAPAGLCTAGPRARRCPTGTARRALPRRRRSSHPRVPRPAHRLARTDAHQGAVALVRQRAFLTIEDLLAPLPIANNLDTIGADTLPSHRFFLALDGIEDPHNLGALLRTADGAGVDGVILPERRSAPISATVAKTSAGASEHVRIARVTNLVRALEQMKQANVWVLGLDERGAPDYMDFDFRTDCVLVLGREGAGLHDLVKKTCDHLLRIPMAGAVSSLNVSVAGAVVMYEAMRQRSRPAPATPKPAAPPKPRKGLGS